MPARLARAAHADMFSPTTGDRVRLADTDLIVEVERDFTTYGKEVKFGGGKLIRDGMARARCPAPRAQSVAEGGLRFVLDLPQAVALRDGDGLALEDGRIVAVHAQPEPLMEVVGPLGAPEAERSVQARQRAAPAARH